MSNNKSMIWPARRSAMERNDIRSFAQLAKLTGIKIPTLTQTRRKHPESFIMYELLQIDKVLGFTDEEWGMIRRTA